MPNWIIVSAECFEVSEDQIPSYGGFGFDSGWVGPIDGPQHRIIVEDYCHEHPPSEVPPE